MRGEGEEWSAKASAYVCLCLKTPEMLPWLVGIGVGGILSVPSVQVRPQQGCLAEAAQAPGLRATTGVRGRLCAHSHEGPLINENSVEGPWAGKLPVGRAPEWCTGGLGLVPSTT